MRNKHPIDALFTRTKRNILAVTVMEPERWWYLSDLAKHLGVRPTTLVRDLKRFVEAGILRSRVDGRRVYYAADPECPILPELRGLLTKTAGLLDVLKDALAEHRPKIRVAFVYGSVARGEEVSASDIDVMIVGSTPLADIVESLTDASKRLARPINPTVYSVGEYVAKVKKGPHFITRVVSGEQLFIVGTDNELAGLAEESHHPKPSDLIARNRRLKRRR